jgi:hypothetical protein
MKLVAHIYFLGGGIVKIINKTYITLYCMHQELAANETDSCFSPKTLVTSLVSLYIFFP